jgi:hypothetical protein
MRVSEVYRQITIYYAPPPDRTWSFRASSGEPLQEHRSAFQARLAINELLDGSSEVTPRRASAWRPRASSASSTRSRGPSATLPRPFRTQGPGDIARLLGAESERRIAVILPAKQRVVELRAFQRHENRWKGDLPANFRVVPNKVALEVNGRATYPEFAIVQRLERAGWRAVWCKNWHGRAFWADIGVVAVVPDDVLRTFNAISNKAGGAGAWDILGWTGERVVFVESKQRGSDKLTTNQLRWLEAALDAGISIDAFGVYEYVI